MTTETIIAKLVTIGEAGVGKTSLVDRFIHNKFENSYKPTIGIEIFIKEVQIENFNIQMQVWDIGGQQQFSLIRKRYFRGAAGALFVWDLTEPETFAKLDTWRKEIIEEIPEPIPYVILGNKKDIVQTLPPVVLPRNFTGNMCKMNVLTSAKTGDRVEEAFYALAEAILVEGEIFARPGQIKSQGIRPKRQTD